MKKIFFCLLVLLGCANESSKTRTIEDYYQSSGIEKYFLSEIPPWANFSATSACFRKKQIRYFDINALMKSYSIDYATAIQIQASFNDEFIRLTKKKETIIPFAEEQLLFFRASDKVNSKIVFFDPPTYKRIHFVWVDGAEEDKIKKFLKSNIHDKGIPVLISFCMTKNELEEKFSESNYKMISAEMFSVFDTIGVVNPGFSLYLDQFFKDSQEVIFYSAQKKIQEIKELRGKYQIINY
jgi:hypothetical protein